MTFSPHIDAEQMQARSQRKPKYMPCQAYIKGRIVQTAQNN